METRHPVSVVYLRKLKLMDLGISLTEQKQMTEKERKIWRIIADSLIALRKRKAVEAEAKAKAGLK